MIKKILKLTSVLMVIALAIAMIPAAALADVFTISFEPNNGGTVFTQDTGEDGKLASVPAAPAREGYAFLGWFYQGSKVTTATAFAEDAVVTADWQEITVSSVSVSPASKTLDAGTMTVNLSATVVTEPSGAQTPAVSWSFTSTPANAVSLSATTGNSITVTALQQGTAIVTAAAGGQSGSCTITIGDLTPVTPQADPSATISSGTTSGKVGTEITPSSYTITLSDATFAGAFSSDDITGWFNLPAGLKATTTPTGAGSSTVSFTVSGKPTASTNGDKTITCTIPGGSLSTGTALTVTQNANAKVNIQKSDVKLKKITISPVKKTLYDTDSFTVQITGWEPEEAEIDTVTFSTGDASVATVDASGVVKAAGYGSTTITVTATDTTGNSVSALCTVSVKPSISQTITPNKEKIGKGETAKITVEVTNPADGYVYMRRSSKRVYFTGYDKIITKNGKTYYRYKLNSDNKATVTVHPQYNGQVTVYTSATEADTLSAKFYVSGYTNLPATGQDDGPLYVLIGAGVVVLAVLGVTYSIKRKKKNEA